VTTRKVGCVIYLVRHGRTRLNAEGIVRGHLDVPLDDVGRAGVAIGAGFAAGLLANAGGFLLAPLFVIVLHRPLKVAFGTSLAAAAMLAIPGTLVHALLGHIDWALAGLFAAASIPLASLGARTALRTSTERLERRYGAFLVATALALLFLDR
jgi:hypothetical protein